MKERAAVRLFLLSFLLLLPSCAPRDGDPGASPPEAAIVDALAELEKNPIRPDEPGKSATLAENADHTLILMQVNGVAQLHYHKEHDEIIQVLQGTGVFNLNGRETEAKPGDLFVIPRGTVHGFRRTGDAPAALLSIYTPRLALKDSFRPPLPPGMFAPASGKPDASKPPEPAAPPAGGTLK